MKSPSASSSQRLTDTESCSDVDSDVQKHSGSFARLHAKTSDIPRVESEDPFVIRFNIPHDEANRYMFSPNATQKNTESFKKHWRSKFSRQASSQDHTTEDLKCSSPAKESHGTQGSEAHSPLDSDPLKKNVKSFSSTSSVSSSASVYDFPVDQHSVSLNYPNKLETSPHQMWNGTDTSTTPAKNNDYPAENFQTDMEKTKCKLRQVQERFSEISGGTADSSELNSNTHVSLLAPALSERSQEKSAHLSCVSIYSEDSNLQLSLDHEDGLRDILSRLKETEEKIVELETDKEFLMRECQQLKTRLCATSAREEELQAFVTESKLVALRDRQALEARHRDSIAELRHLLHNEVSKVESLEQQLRGSDAQQFHEDNSKELHINDNALSNQLSDELHYWKTECTKHMKLREKEEIEFCRQLEDYRRGMFNLKNQLDEASHENARLLTELKKQKKMFEGLVHEHDMESKTYEATIAILEKNIQNLHLDCHNFQKLLRRKEQESSVKISMLCDRFSEFENEHEVHLSERLSEREAQIRQELFRYYEAKWEKSWIALKRRYERLLEKYKNQLHGLHRPSTSSRLKHYIKSEISRAVMETMMSRPGHAVAQKSEIRASSCYEDGSVNNNEHAFTTFVLGTAIAPELTVSSHTGSHDPPSKIYQVLSPNRYTRQRTQSQTCSEMNSPELEFVMNKKSHRETNSDQALEEQTCSSCPRDTFPLRYY